MALSPNDRVIFRPIMGGGEPVEALVLRVMGDGEIIDLSFIRNEYVFDEYSISRGQGLGQWDFS